MRSTWNKAPAEHGGDPQVVFRARERAPGTP
jgi:hypothetical protein